jgi:type IV secretion system protein VirB11
MSTKALERHLQPLQQFLQIDGVTEVCINAPQVVFVEQHQQFTRYVVQQPNWVRLLFNEDDPRITAAKLFKTCLRLRPDRIFLSELRGIEAWPFLRAANSGHPGSLSTVHADTPQGCFDQLVFMMQQAGSTTSEERLRSYLHSIIPIVIQLKRATDGRRFMKVSEVYYDAVA